MNTDEEFIKSLMEENQILSKRVKALEGFLDTEKQIHDQDVNEIKMLEKVCKCALADLEGIMPEFEPSGDRIHPAWCTIEELKAAI